MNFPRSQAFAQQHPLLTLHGAAGSFLSHSSFPLLQKHWAAELHAPVAALPELSLLLGKRAPAFPLAEKTVLQASIFSTNESHCLYWWQRRKTWAALITAVCFWPERFHWIVLRLHPCLGFNPAQCWPSCCTALARFICPEGVQGALAPHLSIQPQRIYSHKQAGGKCCLLHSCSVLFLVAVDIWDTASSVARRIPSYQMQNSFTSGRAIS